MQAVVAGLRLALNEQQQEGQETDHGGDELSQVSAEAVHISCQPLIYILHPCIQPDCEVSN